MRHSGKNAVVKHGSNVIDGQNSFEFTETVGTSDITASGDAWGDHDTTHKTWTGSITMRADHDAAANQTLRAGDVITVEGYTEGEATGKTYLTGSATITEHGVQSSHDATVERTYSLQGKGALSIATVSA